MSETMLLRAIQSKLHVKLGRDESFTIAQRLVAATLDNLMAAQAHYGTFDALELGEAVAVDYLKTVKGK